MSRGTYINPFGPETLPNPLVVQDLSVLDDLTVADQTSLFDLAVDGNTTMEGDLTMAVGTTAEIVALRCNSYAPRVTGGIAFTPGGFTDQPFVIDMQNSVAAHSALGINNNGSATGTITLQFNPIAPTSGSVVFQKVGAGGGTFFFNRTDTGNFISMNPVFAGSNYSGLTFVNTAPLAGATVPTHYFTVVFGSTTYRIPCLI